MQFGHNEVQRAFWSFQQNYNLIILVYQTIFWKILICKIVIQDGLF